MTAKKKLTGKRANVSTSSRFRAYFDHSPVGIFVVDQTGRYIDCNNAAQRMLGYTYQELLARSIPDLLPKHEMKKGGQTFQTLKKTGKFYRELELLRKDGSTIPVILEGIPLPDNTFVAYCTNISTRRLAEKALQESEDMFRQLFDRAHDGILLADPATRRFAYANPRIARMLGRTRKDVLSLDIDRIHPPEALPLVLNEFRKARSKDGRLSSDLPVKRADGTVFFANISASPVRFQGRDFVLGVFRDNTRQKEAEEQVQRALREKETLLRELYHRTKNNMQVICSLLALRANFSANEEVKSVLFEMSNRITSMALVHQKLYQTRDLSRIPLHEYIESLARLVLQSYRLSQEVEVAFDLKPVEVAIDAAIPCGLALNELMSNSLKYAFPEGRKGKIGIQLRQKRGHVEITFADNGIGVPAGFNFHHQKSLGLKSVIVLIEHQLRGTTNFIVQHGVSCHLRFPNVFSRRVFPWGDS